MRMIHSLAGRTESHPALQRLLGAPPKAGHDAGANEQAAEVRRRLAEKNPKTVTLAEFNERLRRRYGL
jgi:hypothetical protein